MNSPKIETLPIGGPLLITPRVFEDHRGWFSETYSQAALAEAIGPVAFVQDNVSHSLRRGTVRGLHFQVSPRAQAKLVRVIRGAMLDVVVDVRAGSPTYGRHVAIEISAASGNQLFVPHGFAHGFCTLEDHTEVAYKVDAPYSAEHERALNWADPDLAIAWPVSGADAIVSEKDRSAPRFSAMSAP